MKVQDILTDESKWCKATWSDGRGARCLISAIFKANEFSPEASGRVRDLVRAKIGGGIVDWNDDPERTFAEVRGLIEELDI